MPPRRAKKRVDDDDENASVDTKTTKQARTASTSVARATDADDADDDAGETDDERPVLHGSAAQTPKVNHSWRGGDEHRPRHGNNSPSASAERGELTFLPAFRRGIRLSELSKQRSFYGRTDSIVGGWARPPSELLPRFQSYAHKGRTAISYVFSGCKYFTEKDRNSMHDLLTARYCDAKSEVMRKLKIQEIHFSNLIECVLLPELMIELVQVACGCETTTREHAIAFLNGRH
jgi:hypothetical protein